MTQPIQQIESNNVSCSIIIPTRDQLDFLRPCIESILRTITDHDVEIIIVDNGSTEAATAQYLETLRGDSRFIILDWPKPFNFSAINNYAAQQSRGDVLCFLNNDIEIANKQWLNLLLPLAARADVGAVGCVLLYPDSTIQHGGIALHAKVVARHIALREPADYFVQQGITSPVAVDAVTAACLLMRKELFLRMGGFNATRLGVAFNDVDLCLRLGEKGLPVLLHPGVQLVHHESVSRKSDDLPSNRSRAEKEHAYMRFRWQHRLAGQVYRTGLPASFLQQKPDGREPAIEETIARASALLYLGSSVSQDTLLAVEEDFDSESGNWRKQYLNLRTDFDNLRAHTLRIERAHQLIERSIFWRVTSPLRWLKNQLSFSGKHRPLSNELQSIPSVENKSGPETELSPSVVLKAEHDEKAQQQLHTFLNAGEKLEFPESSNPAISIILVFYNQAHLSLLCLQSILLNADCAYEVVIVDNNSTDKTAALLDRIQHARIARNAENIGFVRAVNQGVRMCRADFVLLLNNDALLSPHALSCALAVFEREANVGAVGAMIRLLDGSLQEAGSIIWNDGACIGYGRGASPEQGEFRFQRDVDYCSGAFLLFPRCLFEELGGFDEAYAPAYYEESDFCIRLHKHGLRVVYCPDAIITHYEFASSGGLEGASKLQAAHRELLCQRHADYLADKKDNNPDNILIARTSNTYPNVLVIDDRVPHPSLGAGYPRAAHILQTLSKLDLNVSFYPLLFPDESWDAVYRTLPRTTEVLLGLGKPGLQQLLEERAGFYQYIIVSRSHNMEYFNFIANLAPNAISGASIIYDAEAVTAPRDVMRQRLFGAPMSEDQEQAAIRSELGQAQIADIVVTVSQQEAEIFEQLNFEKTIVIGHTLEVAPTPRAFPERADLLFVGALRHDASPNVDSLLWFIINVLPLIAIKIPGVKLHVVGDRTAPSLASVAIDHVLFHGRLDSVVPLYDACRVFVAPTRFAAGIPHKVHEAAAHGLPSVTTSLLAEQLGWQDESQLLMADSPRDFAEQCVRLYQDAALWGRIRANGLDAVTQDCSTARFEAQLASLFD